MQWTECVTKIRALKFEDALAEHLGTTVDDPVVTALLEFAGNDGPQGDRDGVDGFNSPEHTNLFWTDHHELVCEIIELMAQYFRVEAVQMARLSIGNSTDFMDLSLSHDHMRRVMQNEYHEDDKRRVMIRLSLCMMALRVAGTIHVHGDQLDPRSY